MEEPGPTRFAFPSHFQKNQEDLNSDVNFIVPDFEHSPTQIKTETLGDDDVKPKLLSFEENGALVFRNKNVHFLSHHSSCENTETASNSNATQRDFDSQLITTDPLEDGVKPPDNNHLPVQLLKVRTVSLNAYDVNTLQLLLTENGAVPPSMRDENVLFHQSSSESYTALTTDKDLTMEVAEEVPAFSAVRRNKPGQDLTVEEVPVFSAVRKNKKGQCIRKHQKIMLISLYNFKKNDGTHLENKELVQLLCNDTGIGLTSVRRILREYERFGTISSPVIKRNRPKLSEKIGDLVIEEILRKVNNFLLNHERASLKQAMKAINDDNDLPNFKRTTFYAFLKENNFTFPKGRRFPK